MRHNQEGEEREVIDVPEDFLAGMVSLLTQHNTLSPMQIMACIPRAINRAAQKSTIKTFRDCEK